MDPRSRVGDLLDLMPQKRVDFEALAGRPNHLSQHLPNSPYQWESTQAIYFLVLDL